MNIVRTLWQAWKNRKGHKAIPVMEWFPGDDGRLYQLKMRENEFHPRLFVCQQDLEAGNIHRFYTMAIRSDKVTAPVMVEWRKA